MIEFRLPSSAIQAHGVVLRSVRVFRTTPNAAVSKMTSTSSLFAYGPSVIVTRPCASVVFVE
jgi:hypothetical protein